jgi:hypothetical protein
VATTISVEIRLEAEPDAVYREAYRRAAVQAPARPLATELFELLIRERDADAARLMQALGELAGDLVAHRPVELAGEEAEPKWTIDVSAA